MRWIILALSMGAAVTSMIHGVFMLFGSLSGTAVGDMSLWLASLPLISAVIALIGGIVAFNESRWGALFLFAATAMCAFSSKDVWIYGGLYLLAALLCFFLHPRSDFADYDYEDDYDDDEEDEDDEDEDDDEDDDDEASFKSRRSRDSSKSRGASRPLPTQDILASGTQKVRRRTSKSCPTCGAIVAREHHFCPNCGAGLHIPDQDPSAETPEAVEEPVESILSSESAGLTADSPLEGRDPDETLDVDEPDEPDEPEEPTNAEITEALLRRTKSRPLRIIHDDEEDDDDDDDFSASSDPFPLRRVVVRPSREEAELPRRPINIDPDRGYQEFSQYRRRKKKHRSSFGRRILSFFLFVCIVGGALWSLLGLRKLPPDALPTPPPDIPVVASSTDIIVEPVAVAPVSGGTLPAFTPDFALKRGITTGSNVNLRDDHSTSSRSQTRLPVNTAVEILESWQGQSGNLSGTWYRIRAGERSGWVFGRYLQPLGGSLPEGYAAALLQSFGDGRVALAEKLGKPSKSSDTTMEWSGLTVGFSGEDITRLRLTSSKHELKNGLKTGMSQTALFQILGYPTSLEQKQMRYNEGGKAAVSVQLNKDGLVQNITVNAVQ